MVPGHLIPQIGSPIYWSPWTDGPQKFGPPGQMVPRIFRLSMETGCGDPELQGPNWLGTICPGGPSFGGPFVHGDRIFWGPFVQGYQFYEDRLWEQEVEDRKSGDQIYFRFSLKLLKFMAFCRKLLTTDIFIGNALKFVGFQYSSYILRKPQFFFYITKFFDIT